MAADQIQKVDAPKGAKYREFVRLHTTDGKDESHDFQSDDSGEIGVIAKFRPDKDRPDITWLLCAGIALPGVVMHPTPLFGLQGGKSIDLGALS